MERQKINIAQCGVDVTMACRTTIIAAGNPVGNMYKKSKTVLENLKINPALLSRFDLIFIVTKKANDCYPGEDSSNFKTDTIIFEDSVKSPFGERNTALEEFLRLKSNEIFVPVAPLIMQNYIGFSRSHVFPRLTRLAVDKLLEFYLELRHKQDCFDFFPITTRQFHALRRLSIARARVDHADEVTLEHVNDVIQLTRHSMIDIFTTETDELGNRGIQGSGMSKAKQKMRLLDEN